jgi:IS1 family transposase
VAVACHKFPLKVVLGIGNVSRQRIETQLVAKFRSVQKGLGELIVVGNPPVDVHVSCPILYGLDFFNGNRFSLVGNGLLWSQHIGIGFPIIGERKIIRQFELGRVHIYPLKKIRSWSFSTVRNGNTSTPRDDFAAFDPRGNFPGGREVNVSSLSTHQSSASNLVLFQHGAPHKRCYYGVDGHCTEGGPGSAFYRFLSGIGFFILGNRISYRLLVKGDDCFHFKRIVVTWHLLLPFSFLCIAYGFGAFMQSVLYLTQPCEECHDYKLYHKKSLTSLTLCNTFSDMANVLPIDKQIAVIGALAEGSSIRSIERMTGIHRDTIMRLGVKIGKNCELLLDSKMQDLNCNYLQLDEVWGYIGKKEKHCSVDDSPEYGDVWTFCAIDSETKLVPSFKCGKRTHELANEFLQDIARCVRNRAQISTDAMNSYPEAVERAFGADVDYGQIVKVYVHDVGQHSHPERTYSAPAFTKAMRRPISGDPEREMISTSHVERLNATTRLHVKRLNRLTLAFSKKLENFKAAVALHFAYYNLVRRHNTLRCTPAMAAGVEKDFWTVGQLVEATS